MHYIFEVDHVLYYVKFIILFSIGIWIEVSSLKYYINHDSNALNMVSYDYAMYIYKYKLYDNIKSKNSYS